MQSEIKKNPNISIHHPSDNLKEYINIIRQSLVFVLLIFFASVIVTIIYVSNAVDIYKSTTTIKINKQQGILLTSTVIPEWMDMGMQDRMISNEVEVLKSYSMKEKVAGVLLDSFQTNPNKSLYFYIINRNPEIKAETTPFQTLISSIGNIVSVSQKRGLDIVEISAESPSRYEAKLIANVYANIYLQASIEFSRREITAVRKFLEEEKEKKLVDLNNSESAIQDFQQRGGAIFLDDKAKNLVSRISELDAQKSNSDIEFFSQQKAYTELKNEMGKVDRSILDYFDGKMNEPSISELQKKISELEVLRDVEATIPQDGKLRDKVLNNYNKKIEPLKKSLDEKTVIFKNSLFAYTPNERQNVLTKLFETNLSLQTAKARQNIVAKLLGKYESDFAKLPTQSLEYARLDRARKSSEKLFTLLEEKYQEALVNERSQLGNAMVIDVALMPGGPTKPNRKLIIIAGCLMGLALGIGFSFLRNYLDRSIKSPEDIESKGISVLAWIPSIEELKELGSSQLEFIIANKPNASASESFKALRTRVQFSRLETDPLKTILVTSSIPSEGKTTVALNLAGSFAQADKRTLLLDCDLRKPRVHAIFETERFPGMTDYLFANSEFKDIVRKSKLSNFDFITSGTIPPNPSELLGSRQMKEFLEFLKAQYDNIVVDSPPFISVTDSEILSRITDGTILIVQANKTPNEAFFRTYERIVNIDEHKLLGAVLNNFMFKSAYGYYYNYYYYYSRPETTKKKPLKSLRDSISNELNNKNDKEEKT
jgi:tyrosine-protein kinase Etk/Wzc